MVLAMTCSAAMCFLPSPPSTFPPMSPSEVGGDVCLFLSHGDSGPPVRGWGRSRLSSRLWQAVVGPCRTAGRLEGGPGRVSSAPFAWSERHDDAAETVLCSVVNERRSLRRSVVVAAGSVSATLTATRLNVRDDGVPISAMAGWAAWADLRRGRAHGGVISDRDRYGGWGITL